MNDFALVIFDCDGVLVDSELLSAQVLREELARIGIEIDMPYFYRNCLGRPYATVAERIGHDRGRAIGVEFEAHFLRRLLEKFEKELTPIAGAREVLARLPTAFCIATSSNAERAARALEISGLSDLAAGRLFSVAMAARGKPWPDLFLLAAERQGVEPHRCLVIEDSDMGVQAARAAGMPVWRFTGGSHYRAGGRWMAGGQRADLDFDDMGDFLSLLNGQ